MERNEIQNELKMSYDELVDYLIQKYGAAKYDYFTNFESMTKNKKVRRTGEGLFCHHIDEDKGGDLSSEYSASKQPLDWQKKERLVYCNILEHLILHMKIAVLRQKSRLEQPLDIMMFFTTGGVFMICNQINDMFIANGTKKAWLKRCFEEIEDNYEEYILLIVSLMKYIEINYIGNKSKTTVYTYPEDFKTTYADQYDEVLRKLSSGFESFYSKIYNDIILQSNENSIKTWVDYLKIDCHIVDFLQWAYIKLDKSYGSPDANKYISKALPMYSPNNVELDGKTPHFWKGPVIPKDKIGNSFYIVRMETEFSIKAGMEPCVIYRERDLLRNKNVFKGPNDHSWDTLHTSMVFDKKTKRYYRQYRNVDGKVVNATVIISLGKDDLNLFYERYEIWSIRILDGCYF